jgi:hypothetical protein
VLKQFIKSNRALRTLAYGTKISADYFLPRIGRVYRQIWRDGEVTNWTYDLADRNLLYIAQTIALVVRKPVEEIEGYLREPSADPALSRHRYGRRLGWYAIARALKPSTIVETGVERGHGAVLLCAAIERNGTGRYYGTDIDPKAGALFTDRRHGEILFGDSIESIAALSGPIDLFINDSDHSADYEADEYLTIQDKLAPNALILGDNAHVTDKLARFAQATGRHFLFVPEIAKDHWYSGAGIGIAFR